MEVHGINDVIRENLKNLSHSGDGYSEVLSTSQKHGHVDCSGTSALIVGITVPINVFKGIVFSSHQRFQLKGVLVTYEKAIM